jgi:hypothetical protein
MEITLSIRPRKALSDACGVEPAEAGVSPIIEEVAHRFRVMPHATTASQ